MSSISRIGIIGSGIAGLASAWLLQEKAAITVFEKSDYIGGHSRSIPVIADGKTVHVDMGFKYLLYPSHRRVFALLQLLGVSTRHFKSHVSMVFPDQTLVTPPHRAAHVLELLKSPQRLIDVMCLAWFAKAGRTVFEERNWTPTLRSFLESGWFPPRYGERFLFPFFAANWGATSEIMADFPAYDVLHVLAKATTDGYDIEGGTSHYIQRLVQSIQADLRVNQGIQRVIPQAEGVELVDEQGVSHFFDQVILALPPHHAARLLPTSSPWQQVLSGFRFFDTHIVVHSDPRLMPPNRADWSIVNQFHANGQAFLTEWSGIHENAPVFRTWLPAGRPLPAPLHAEQHFQHLVVTPQSLQLQQQLEALQGQQRIWAAGMYVTEVDIHESSLLSAMNLSERLSPTSPQLQQLKRAIASIVSKPTSA